MLVSKGKTIIKHLSLIVGVLCLAACLAGSAAAQSQQPDSVPPPSVWVRANTPSHSGVVVDYLSPDTCWGGGSDVGVMLSTDGGVNWNKHAGQGAWMISAHDGFGFRKAWTYKTSDAWATYDSFPGPQIDANGIAIVDSTHIFISSSDQIGRTTDGGKTWTVQGIPTNLNCIGFANAKVGYAAGTGCVKTTDGGNTWNPISTGMPDFAYGIVAINPLIAIIVGGVDLIYRTSDGGGHWQPIQSAAQAALNGIAMHGARGYIGGSRGLILSTVDSGKSWAVEPSGLNGNVFLYDPVMCGDSLAAFGGDSGLILIRRTVSSGVARTQRDLINVNVHPNPAQESITLQYTLSDAQHVTLTIYDVSGQLVATVLDGVSQSPGNQSATISMAHLASGTYIYQLSSEHYTSSGSFTLIK